MTNIKKKESLEVKPEGFWNEVTNSVFSKTETVDSDESAEENLEKGLVKKGAQRERKIHAPLSRLENKIEIHTKADNEKAKLSSEIKNNSLNKPTNLLSSKKLGLMISKITGQDLEKDVKIVQKISGNESNLGSMLDKFEHIEGIKDRFESSFLSRISGFFGKKLKFDPEEFLTEDGKMKKLGEYWKEKLKTGGFLASVGAVFRYQIVSRYKKELALYRPAKKLIESIGGVIERVKSLGAKATDFLEKFKPSREKIYTARKLVTSAPKMIRSFLKNPKKESGRMFEFLKKGNRIPGFAEGVKAKKIKGFRFRGSGSTMMVILSQKVISEIIEEDSLEEEESFAQKWVPGVGLWEREWPSLMAAIKQNGIMNSKIELAGFLLQAGFDIATVWAIIAFVITSAPVALAVGVAGASALRTGSLLAIKKLIGEGLEKYGQKKLSKEIIKKGSSFALATGGPIALNTIISSIIPTINKKVIETVQMKGNLVAQKLFTPQQMRAARMYKKMKTR